LGSLSLSMADEISIPMALRLRGNANACNRSAEQNRRVLQGSRGDDPAPDYAAIAEAPETEATTSPDDDLPAPGALLSPAAVQELAAEAQGRLCEPEQTGDRPAIPAHRSPPVATDKTAEKRHQEMWAIAMVKEAAELTASIPNLPASERSAAEIRAAALGSTAHELLTVNWRLPPLGEPTRPAPT
jgi:hypothetical protein